MKLRPTRQKRGQTMILVALLLVVLFSIAALAVDYGLMVMKANQIQRACDSAALAGAAKLVFTRNNFSINNNSGATSTVTVTAASQTAAQADAILVAARNGATITAANVTFPTINRVQVRAPGTSPFFLARLFGGGSSGSLTRQATAERKGVSGIGGAAPLGITSDDYNTYRIGSGTGQGGRNFSVDLVVNQRDDFQQGNAIALSMDDNPSKPVGQFQREMEDGSSENVGINNIVNSLNGTTSVQNASYDALSARITQNRTIFPIMIIPPKVQTNGTSYFVGNMVMVELISVNAPSTGRNKRPTSFTLRFVDPSGLNMEQFNPTLSNGAASPSDIYVLRLVDDI